MNSNPFSIPPFIHYSSSELETPCQDLTLTQRKLSGEPSQLSWGSICFCNLGNLVTISTAKYLDTWVERQNFTAVRGVLCNS